MSKQAKKREINKYRVKIAQLKNSIKLEIESEEQQKIIVVHFPELL